MKRTILVACITFSFFMFSEKVFAEPTSSAVYVSNVRIYSAQDTKVFVAISSNALCNTSVFTIDTSAPNGKEMYIAALSAVITKKPVMIEILNATGCAGWATQLQSIYLLSD